MCRVTDLFSKKKITFLNNLMQISSDYISILNYISIFECLIFNKKRADEEGVQDESLGYATRLLSFLFSPKFLQCSNLLLLHLNFAVIMLVQLQQVPVVVASICPYRSACLGHITMSVVVLLMYDLTILGVAILYNTS
ncbi:hypothetical protein ACJX0J_008446, partial [Zea mays]